jgi:hypothetical protein
MKFVCGVVSTALSAGMFVNLALAASAAPTNPGISITQRDGNVSINTCIQGAEQALRRLKFEDGSRFRDIKVGKTYVEANWGEYSALVTCYTVASAKGVVVQGIVIAGPSSTVAQNISKQLISAIR